MGLLQELPSSEMVSTLEALAHLGVTREHLTNLRKDKKLAFKISCLIRSIEVSGPYEVSNLFSYVPLAKMIKSGNYDFVNDNITEEHFSLEGKGYFYGRELFLVHFHKSVRVPKKILEQLDILGFEASEISELLMFDATYPIMRRAEIRIYALKSALTVGDDFRYVCSCRHETNISVQYENDRILELYPYEDELWHGKTCILAHRKFNL
ncbi:hypothetical protein JW977_01305 [Candidatus Falkowbacteria bacterium]|nr:hypothetical protein [Candidatus Falkowbacteria bacterium]